MNGHGNLATNSITSIKVALFHHLFLFMIFPITHNITESVALIFAN